MTTPPGRRAFRSGFACFVGRPNAGKSTLTNALLGQKVAITSSRPQTTRHAVRGIVHRPDAQLVLVDTPGLHKPRTLLGERLNDLVRETYAGVDVICFCVTADDKIGPGDRFIAAELAQVKTPVVAVLTKTDAAEQAADRRAAARARRPRRLGRDRAGQRRAAAPRSTCSPTCSCSACPRARRSTRTASSPTSRSRCSSPS